MFLFPVWFLLYFIHLKVIQASSMFIIEHFECLPNNNVQWNEYTASTSSSCIHSSQYLVDYYVFKNLFFILFGFSCISSIIENNNNNNNNNKSSCANCFSKRNKNNVMDKNSHRSKTKWERSYLKKNDNCGRGRERERERELVERDYINW